MKAKHKRLTVGSLCTGIGGLDLATEAYYGARMVWCSEIEPSVLPVIERHWPGRLNIGDVKAVDWASVPKVDIITAGYPCQPFSHAGKRRGEDDPRHLWPYIIEAVRQVRPARVVLENVRGHLSKGFSQVVQDLAEAGFDAEWCVLRASDVGAPHQRARVFIVAADTDRIHDHGGWATGARGGTEPADGGGPAPHPGGERLPWGQELDGQPEAGWLPEGAARDDTHGLGVAQIAWGPYGGGVRRWELILGRPAPTPTDDQGRLSPAFVEWMMGYPQGWVDGLTRTQALKALGNAVVPQQGLAALGILEPAIQQLPPGVKGRVA